LSGTWTKQDLVSLKVLDSNKFSCFVKPPSYVGPTRPKSVSLKDRLQIIALVGQLHLDCLVKYLCKPLDLVT